MRRRQQEIEERIIAEAWCLYENELTVREVANRFKVSKTTVHTDMRKKLPQIMNLLAIEVDKVLNKNKAERHIRGGEATRIKYKFAKIE